ncbi:MAG: DUF4166 domain-containing protein [Candidatus Thiodiazotropha lotti]
MKTEKPTSIMKLALGEQWDLLDDIVKSHYEMAPGTTANVTIHGRMDQVFHSNIAKLFLLPGRAFGALVPYRGRNIPTEVRNWTRGDNQRSMFWHRVLQFPGKPKTEFKSRMEYAGGSEIIEFVKYGLGIRMRMSVKDGALVFISAGYVWDMGGARVPIPTWAILGDAEIIEKGISDDEFYIDFNMVHPLFGRTFGYSGVFSIKSLN